MRSWHSSKRSRLWTGFVLDHQVSTPTPRTKPESTRPPEIRSAMASCSAIRTGLSSIGKMLLEDQQLGPRRGAGKDPGRHVDADVDARRCGVVLVDHQPVEAGPVGEFVLVEIALVVRPGFLRAEEPVRKVETERRILGALLVGELVVWHLAEVVELHGRMGPRRKSITRRANVSGCSMGGRWPHFSRTDSVALPSSRRYCSPQSRGTTRSSRPQTMSAGFVTRGRNRASRGLCI